jgi:hypothetical protein
VDVGVALVVIRVDDVQRVQRPISSWV